MASRCTGEEADSASPPDMEAACVSHVAFTRSLFGSWGVQASSNDSVKRSGLIVAQIFLCMVLLAFFYQPYPTAAQTFYAHFLFDWLSHPQNY